jgi:ubiquinone/menaquinone biosynthesis C-methylase UbiE
MSTDPKTVKAYDEFAKTWSKKRQSGQSISHTCLEKPAMYSKLPDLNGKKVLCVGCGTGEECKYLSSQGAEVVGIDISKGLIEVARKNFPTLEFKAMDMEHLKFPNESFDYVYSSLTLHYVPKWLQTLKQVYRVLKPDGIFLFSTHHPVKWGAHKDSNNNSYSIKMGYTKNKKNKTCKVYGNYLNTMKIRAHWYNQLVVYYYHRPLSDIVQDIVKAKFQIIDFLEPKSTLQAKEKDKCFWEIHQKIPLFMIFELRKGE